MNFSGGILFFLSFLVAGDARVGGVVSASHYLYSENEVAEFNLPNSWKPRGSGKPLSIDGYAPVSGGPFPVYVWLPGTYLSHWSDDVKIYAMDMARRGFVAVSVDYANESYPRECQEFNNKAADVFGPKKRTAISALCTLRDDADCTGRGIAVSGFSQGANIANLARNYNPQVRAAYLVGNVEPVVSDCWDSGDTLIDGTRVRSVMGELDEIAGGSYDKVRASLVSTTGINSCGTGAYDCIIEPGGHGWYIVQPAETASGGASHCFQHCGDNCFCTSSGSGVFDANYYSDEPVDPEFVWGMRKSHEWLSTSSFYVGNGTLAQF